MAPGGFGRDRTPGGAHPRVHHRQRHPRRQVLDGPHQGEGPGAYIADGDAVGDVYDPALRRNPRQHPVHHADELVAVSEVGQKRDRSGHGLLLGGRRRQHIPRRRPGGEPPGDRYYGRS